MRLENIRRNQEAMRAFNIPEAMSIVADIKKRSAPVSTPGVKREKRVKNTELLPRRQSNRLAKIEVNPLNIENLPSMEIRWK